MKCPYCRGKTEVFSIRHTKTKGLRRSRLCKNCDMTFITTEIIDENSLVMGRVKITLNLQ